MCFATKLVFPYVFSTWKIFIIYQVVVVGQFHSITPTLLHFPLDIWKSGGAPIWKSKEYSSENLNLTPTGDLCERCLSFIIPLKDTAWNGTDSITSCSTEDPVGTCRLDSRNREISRNQALKQKLKKRLSFNYYFFECTLNDTLTAKHGDQYRRQQPKWDHPWFVPETTSILSTFAYRSCPPPRVLNICR